MNKKLPQKFGAIDAGSNAMRFAAGKAMPNGQIERMYNERISVRLGENVFRTQNIGRKVRKHAVDSFRTFRNLLEQFEIKNFRAVATSAAREASDQNDLVAAIREATGIKLEVIDAAEEARLVRVGCLSHLGETVSPSMIVDVGGGSLQISLLKDRKLERFVPLKIGMLRLRDTFIVEGAIGDKKARTIYDFVITQLREHFSSLPDIQKKTPALACAGNAEDLARLTATPRPQEFPAIQTDILRALQPAITRANDRERMRLFEVKKDRAEVMGLAAITFCALSDFFKVETWQVPGLGVKDGILYDLLEKQLEKN